MKIIIVTKEIITKKRWKLRNKRVKLSPCSQTQDRTFIADFECGTLDAVGVNVWCWIAAPVPDPGHDRVHPQTCRPARASSAGAAPTATSAVARRSVCPTRARCASVSPASTVSTRPTERSAERENVSRRHG